jgi:hypothetical protein
VNGAVSLWLKGPRLGKIKNKIYMHVYSTPDFCVTLNNNNNPWRYSSDETWPAEQPPLAVFPDCTRRYLQCPNIKVWDKKEESFTITFLHIHVDDKF